MTHESSAAPSQPPTLDYKLPGQTFLWIAVILFAASNSVVRKLTDLGAANVVNGHNPISPCNVLFVSNLCALLLLIPVYFRQLNWSYLKTISRKEWWFLIVVSILSGALAPALIFQALSTTMVTNVVLVSRIEPPLILGLSVWLLHDRLNRWEIIGTFVSLMGVVLTVSLQSSGQGAPGLMGLGKGELLTLVGVSAGAIATVLSKAKLSHISLGVFTVIRMVLGTIVFFVLAISLYGSNHFAEAFSPFLWQWMLLYGTAIVAVGQLCWFRGLRTSTTAEVSLVNSFSPLAGILTAALILNEQLMLAHYLGGAVIVVGLLINQYGIAKKTQFQAPTQTIATMQEMEARAGFRGL